MRTKLTAAVALALGLSVGAASQALAAPLDQARQAFNNGQYTQAVELVSPLAKEGNPQAQLFLAYMFSNADGLQNTKRAAKWFRRAANRGEAAAQYALGVMYDNGEGMPEDPSAAAEWYQKAAQQGLAKAQYNLAVLFDRGRGVSASPERAAQWYQSAAEQGHAKAQYNAGFLYARGIGVDKDPNEAARWFRKAAEQGYGPAGRNYAYIQEYVSCIERSVASLLDQALICTTEQEMLRAIRERGAESQGTDNGFQVFDSATLLTGSERLKVRFEDGRFVEAIYEFGRMRGRGQSRRIISAMRTKMAEDYGEADKAQGNPNVGRLNYIWRLNDGISIHIRRTWPEKVMMVEIRNTNLM